MTSEKFFQSKTAIITLFAACFVVLISLGVRQTFGLFFMDFNESLNISNTAFGFAIGLQMLMILFISSALSPGPILILHLSVTSRVL